MFKLSHINLFILSTLLFTGCVYHQSASKFPTVQNVFEAPIIINESNIYALSPDGKTIIDNSFNKTNLITGEQEQMFTDTVGLKNYGSTGGLMGWSVDGHYLAATQIVYASDSTIIDRPVAIIDIRNNTAQYYKGAFNGWSAVNSERFLTNNFTLTNVSNGSEIQKWEISDFQNTNVKGSKNFLWDVNNNIPIAILASTLMLDSNGIEVKKIQISSYDTARTINKIVYTENQNQSLIDWLFDPTGKYILLTVWEHSEIPIEGESEISGKFVTDSIIILLDWQTGNQVEIFRISSIDNEKVIATSGGTSWSADGSTILVSRIHAPAIIMKLKY